MADTSDEKRITLRDLNRWTRDGEPFAMLTCYDATTAAWLWRGGVRTLLVGDTAAQVILGHDSTLPASMDFMVTITAAVRRGAPHALVLADMPFGSYQADDGEAVRNAARFLKEAGADAVKLEVEAAHAPLVRKLTQAGIPVIAHIGSRPQQIRSEGGYRAAGKREAEARELAETASVLVEHGAAAILVEAVPGEVGRRIVEAANLRLTPSTGFEGLAIRQKPGSTSASRANPATNAGSDDASDASREARADDRVPVIGCGAGPSCHGHVVVLQDLLRMTDWQPPFVTPTGEVGQAIQTAAAKWVEMVRSGEYLKDGGPYRTQ